MTRLLSTLVIVIALISTPSTVDTNSTSHALAQQAVTSLAATTLPAGLPCPAWLQWLCGSK